MAKLAESFKEILGETRAVKEESRRGRGGINYAYSMVNVEPTSITGEVGRSKGFKEVHNFNNSLAVQNMKFTKDTAGVLRLIAINDGNVCDVTNWDSTTPSEHTVKASGLAKGFVDIIPCTERGAGNFLTFLDGVITPRRYNFSTMTELTSDHIASFGIFEKDRLWTNVVSEPNLIKWSAGGNCANYTATDDAGFLPISDGFSPVTSLSKIFVPASNTTNIVISKRDEIYAISGSSGNSADADKFTSYEINKGQAGTTSPRGLLQVGQEVYIMSENDISLYSSVLSDNGIIKQQDIALPERDMYKKMVIPEGIKDAFLLYSKYDGRDGRVYAFVPTITAGKNNYAFCYDKIGGWFRRDFQSFSFTCYDKDPVTNKIYLGSSDGRIFEFNPKDYYSYNGEGYNSFIDYGFTDFNAPNVTKSATTESFIDISVSGQANIDISVIKRSANGYVKPTKMPLNINPAQGIYDSSKYDETIRDASLSCKKKLDIRGSFEELCVQLSIYDPNINFKIKNLYLEAQSTQGN